MKLFFSLVAVDESAWQRDREPVTAPVFLTLMKKNNVLSRNRQLPLKHGLISRQRTQFVQPAFEAKHAFGRITFQTTRNNRPRLVARRGRDDNFRGRFVRMHADD